MKLIIVATVFFVSLSSWASKCPIDFENEVAANPLTLRLFKHIKDNARILNKKGYELVSAISGRPTHVGFIMLAESGKLDIQVHSLTVARVWGSQVDFTNEEKNVVTLLKRMPPCP
jgi:hypothetical protein